VIACLIDFTYWLADLPAAAFRFVTGRCRCGGAYSTHRERWPHGVAMLVSTCRRCGRTRYR
jgi:hypothetical protein